MVIKGRTQNSKKGFTQHLFSLRKKGAGFTVLELLIVIAVAVILASVVFAVFKEASQRARIAQGWQFSDSLRAALQADMVAWWPLNEIRQPGNITPDMYFNQLHGTVYGATVEKGIVNNALSFNGSSDYVRIFGSENKFNLATTTSFTAEAWVALLDKGLTGIPNYQYILSKRISGYDDVDGFQLYSQGDFYARFLIRDNGSSVYVTGTSVSVIVDGTWHHIVGVRDVESDTIRIYVDGVLENSREDTTQGDITPNIDLHIGVINYYDATGAYVNGLIDEVHIYSAALPQAEIQRHYAEGLKTHQNLAKISP